MEGKTQMWKAKKKLGQSLVLFSHSSTAGRATNTRAAFVTIRMKPTSRRKYYLNIVPAMI